MIDLQSAIISHNFEEDLYRPGSKEEEAGKMIDFGIAQIILGQSPLASILIANISGLKEWIQKLGLEALLFKILSDAVLDNDYEWDDFLYNQFCDLWQKA